MLNFTALLSAVLIGLAILAAGISRNRYIKRRMLVSVLFALTALILEVAPQVAAFFRYPLTETPTLGKIATLLVATSVINIFVVLVLNPFWGSGVSESWPSIVQDAFVLAGVVICGLFVAPEAFLALGVASSVLIGLALKDTLGNLFAGLALQSEKPFHVGDWVVVSGEEGQVVQATWRATKIRTKAGNFVIIPNSRISLDAITNYSMPTPVTRLERRIRMGYEVPPNLFKKIAVEACQDVPEILKDPKPDVLTHEYSEYAILYRCRFWVDGYRRSEPISNKFLTLLYYRLERAGIVLPVPARDVRVTQVESPEEAEVADARRAFVDRVDLFAPLPETVKELIASSLEAVTFASNEAIVRQGDKGDSMFFIHRGGVRIVLESDGSETDVTTLEAGQYFGEMSLLTGEARTATAYAVGDVDAFLLHKNSFKSILEENPFVLKHIGEVMVERREGLEATEATLADKKSTKEEKAESFLKKVNRFFGFS